LYDSFGLMQNKKVLTKDLAFSFYNPKLNKIIVNNERS